MVRAGHRTQMPREWRVAAPPRLTCSSSRAGGTTRDGPFLKVTEVAPEALDGYWGLARVEEQAGEWQQVQKWYDAARCHAGPNGRASSGRASPMR